MKIVKEYKYVILIGILLVAFYLITRVYNLTLIPIFTDESIYIRWAQIAKQDAAWRFISLTDGKQPLFVWLMMFTLKAFKDPLFAGRIASVLCGLGSMIGLFFLGNQLFRNKRIGLLVSFLYLFYPFAFVYDRMALYDSMVGLFTVWSLFFEVLLIQTIRLDVALLLGMVIGGSLLTKSSGLFNIYLLPFSLILFPWKEKNWKKFMTWVVFALIAAIEAEVIYSVLRLSPLFNMIATKNNVFIYSFSEWFTHPLKFLIGNLKGLINWVYIYYGLPMTIILIASIIALKNNWREYLLLTVWFIAPFFALALFGRVLYPRFIFFMTLPLLILIGLFFEDIYKRLNKISYLIILLVVITLPWIYRDWQISFNPYTANIPEADKGQYYNSWPSGGGINETVIFLNDESQKGKIFVGIEGTFGSPEYALEIYLIQNKNIELKGYWPLGKTLPSEVLDKVSTMPTYFVFNETQNIPPDWPLQLISRYQKGIGNYYLSIYRVVLK